MTDPSTTNILSGKRGKLIDLDKAKTDDNIKNALLDKYINTIKNQRERALSYYKINITNPEF